MGLVEARGAKGERCRWVVERKGLPLPLLEQTLPFSPVGWVTGVVVQASRDRMDHDASTLTQTDTTSHLQDAFEPQFLRPAQR